ncbi:SusC/RagA family TonB-linked outer membrane protein [Rhodohalobacter barkolensis]|uniref:SusC/RagA family TonB-linked outer membrane protein n=1 Tax=Rhodohalobacter barkolensis TaxID=2053187 RepID=A0A2N0VEV6_9BACT|nr:TonB-dependent receptor [Rhodohalobacter barkolensis]PKD42732.1 SusC/RagA family TonB-linked outer membrane protein [Rhodohalobacter barkolensis]
MLKRILSIIGSALFVAVFSSSAVAQYTVEGTVSDQSDGAPLPGATVVLVDTDYGVATDADGYFELTDVPEGTYQLRVTYVGYVPLTRNIDVNQDLNLDLSLSMDAQSLQEVVVTGYGSVVREEMTGNITSISAREIEEIPVNSFESALQGQASGVFIQRGTGKLGQGINIRVRGTSSVSASSQPLYVIDGIPVTAESQSTTADTNPLADINPDDIESIDILKDAAAAAIYGSRAANGVVLVTTKRGKAGATQVNVSLERGVSSPTNKVEWLNADEYIEFFTEAAERSPFGDLSGPGYLEPVWFDDFAQGTDWRNREVDTNWQDEAFQDAHNTDFNMQVSGGTESTRFFISGGVSDQVGITRGDEFNRMNARLNVDHTASDRLTVGMNLGVTRTENIRISNDNAFSTPLQAVAQPPISPAYTPQFDNGNLAGFSDDPNEETLYYNFLRHVRGVDNNQTIFRNVGNLYADYTILPNLQFRSELGLDLMFQNEDYYADRTTNAGENTAGYGDSRIVNIVNYTTNNYLTWDTQFAEDHKLTAVAGMSYQSSDRYLTFVSGTNYPTDSFTKIASAADITGGSSSLTVFRFLSYFSRTNYTFKDRYLLSASARVDGSSRFGENERYGFFPSLSAGWIVSREEFMSDVDFLSFLKLRASYGLTGNANVGNFPSRGLFSATGYSGTSGMVPSQLPNPDLKWEQTAQYNFGLDFELVGDRISGEIDYYIKKTDDLLLNVNVPSTSGFTSQLRNVGELENKGFEFVVNTHNLVGEFQWTSNFNIAFNENKITDLGGQIITGGFLNRAVEGEPIAVMWGKEYAGVDPDNGDALYYLHSDDGKDYDAGTTNSYSEANDVVIGDPNPDFVGGLGNRFSYKNFDLNVLLQFVYGNDIYNGGGRYQSANGDFFDNQTKDQLNRWQEPGDITDVPEARLFGGNGSNPSSRYIHDASYLRLKNVVLGYTLPQSALDRMGLRRVRLYVSGVNLLTFTDYPGWDPEVNTDLYSQSNNLNIGNEFYSVPQARTISFGVNIGF